VEIGGRLSAAFASSIGSFFSQPANVRKNGGKANSEPGKSEKFAFGLEERLHEGIIDIPPVTVKQGKFWKAGTMGRRPRPSCSSSSIESEGLVEDEQEDEKSSG